MVSFLNKLKGENLNQEQEEAPKQEEEKPKKTGEFSQLEVDVLQTSNAFVIYAPVAGVDMSNIDLAIENENDVVTIQGKKDLPNDGIAEDKKFLRQECKWGDFYRQIILPQEINVAEVTAKIEKGILVVRLPFLRLQGRGKKKIQIGNQ